MKEYRAVLFDFWHTIAVFERKVDIETTKEIALERMKEILREFGYSVDMKEFKSSLDSAILRREKVNREGYEVSSWITIASTLEGLGVDWKGPIVGLLRKEYRNIVLQSGLVPRDDLKEVLEYLVKKSKRIALVSNTSQGDLERKFLEKYGLLKYFDALFFSSEEGYRKPRVEIFQEALLFLNLKPSEVLHVGDLPELDLVGAKESGIDSCILREKGSELDYSFDGYTPDYLIDNLSGLMEIV